MKIISHDLQMASAYSFSQELLSARTSFESMLTMPNELIDGGPDIDAPGLSVLNPGPDVQTPRSAELLTGDYSGSQTLFGIIERLIQSLHERMSKNMESFDSQTRESMFSRRLSIQERYMESESFSFSTRGRIVAENAELDIDIDFCMSRSFAIENRIDIHQSFDPLVINVNGELPELSQTRFSFDLDNDGKEDQISSLKCGSGFLALDKNEDGEINQGSELFGTMLGNGFAELGEYDLDHNSWIDENDSIFDKLRIWFTGEDEKRELVGLGEAGVGAIYLNSTPAEFSYKTDKNQTLGKLKASGIFLHENGLAGTISQIDLDLGKGEGKRSSRTPLSDLLQA